MYIGLFLLIPFLNAMWRGLKGQKQKILLIATLLALTTLPSLFNIYDWHTPEFWQLPSSASSADQGRIRSINSPKKQPGFRLFFVFPFYLKPLF